MQYFDFFLRIIGKELSRSFSFLGFYSLVFSFFSFYPSCFADFEEDAVSGNFILEQSIKSILLLKTIKTDIRMDIVVEGAEFSARGRYEEQIFPKAAAGSFLRSMYRLDVNFLSDVPVAPDSEPNRMTLVCHLDENRAKNQIWQYTSIEGKKSFDIIRVSSLEDAIKRSKKELLFGPVSSVKNLGGLAAQLRQLAYFYDFKMLKSEEKNGTPAENVWKITGSIKPELFEKTIARFGGVNEKKQYPSDFPSDTEIWFGKDDFFPHKIIYHNRPSEQSPKRVLLYQASYFNVELNGREIPASQFSTFEQGEYPDGVFGFTDITTAVIRSLGLR